MDRNLTLFLFLSYDEALLREQPKYNSSFFERTHYLVGSKSYNSLRQNAPDKKTLLAGFALHGKITLSGGAV